MVLVSLLVFFVMFSFLILIHEAGHFFAARWSGVKVLEFGLGFGKTLWKKRIGETDYTYNAVPFGGFVRMLGEDEASDDPRSFDRAPLWKRILITLAGIIMNFLFCVLALSALFMIGTEPLLVDTDTASITSAEARGWVTPGPALSPEYVKGLTPRITTTFNAQTAELFQTLWSVQDDPVQRAAVAEQINALHPDLTLFNDAQKQLWTTMLQVMAGDPYPELTLNTIQLPLLPALRLGASESLRLSRVIVQKAAAIPREMIRERGVPEGLAGPVGIAEMTHQITSSTRSLSEIAARILKFSALLSLSLAVMNLLPLPALDGGRFFFQLIELLTPWKVPAKWEQYAHVVGFLALMLLLVLITYNDILRLFQS
ncbi:site-2 protease family protein [Candidatus Peribacteria bacterium]|nr:site-2 protease family protein [Candidatus Peribacteria bacterium]